MIAANKRLLKATLTEGVLQIQTNLIQLYSNNLSAIGTQAALIAGFAFSAVTENHSSEVEWKIHIAYVFVPLYTICFVAALFALSQATIVVMYGPSYALKGDSSKAVQEASEKMRKQQSIVLKIGCTSIAALFMGSCLHAWVSIPYGIAAITTFIHVVGFAFIVVEGKKAFDDFQLENDITKPDQGTGYSAVSGEEGKVGPDGRVSEAGSISGAMQDQDPMKLKVKGVIWKREPLEQGGNFVKRFAVLEKGMVDIFKREQDFVAHENPINKKPYKLWQYILETDPRKFAKSVTSIQNAFKSTVLGNDDFSMKDLMGNEYDLAYAAKHYKFALLPKVASELATAEIVEFLAHDERSFKHWIRALSAVIDAYDLAGRTTIEETMRTGASDVETAVRAANL